MPGENMYPVFLCFQGPVGVTGLKGARGTQGQTVSHIYFKHATFVLKVEYSTTLLIGFLSKCFLFPSHRGLLDSRGWLEALARLVLL